MSNGQANLSAKELTFLGRLSLALQTAFLISLINGASDVSMRVWNMQLEWFEVYLAFLLPAIFFCSIFFICFGTLEVFLALFGRLKTGAYFKRFYTSFNGATFVYTLLGVALAALIGAGLLLSARIEKKTPAAEFYTEVLAVVLIIFLLLGALIKSLQLGGFPRMVAWYQTSLLKRMVDSLGFFIKVLVLTCIVLDIYLMHNDDDSVREVKVAQGAPAPNVILITLDTVRAQNLSFHGYVKQTMPFLHKLSEQSAVFLNALSTTSWTLPSHASIFTGNWIYHHGASGRPAKLMSEHSTLAEQLTARGYRSAGFVGGPFCKAKYGIAQGFEFYKDRLDFFEYNNTLDYLSVRRLVQFIAPRLWPKVFGADGEKLAPEINDEALRWLDSGARAPFFMFINYFDAHDPYTAGGQYLSEFISEEVPYGEVDKIIRDIYHDRAKRYALNSPALALREAMIALYDSELRVLDQGLKEFFEELTQRNLLENTIIVITSDHGEEFFEHGGVTHRQTLYQEVMHVPLLFYFPQKIPAVRIDDLVSNLDIFATIFDLLQLSIPDRVDSVSLMPLIKGEKRTQRPLIMELYGHRSLLGIDMRSVAKNGWKLIDVADSAPRVPSSLFDLTKDPLEQRNLYNELPQRREEMYELLRQVPK